MCITHKYIPRPRRICFYTYILYKKRGNTLFSLTILHQKTEEFTPSWETHRNQSRPIAVKTTDFVPRKNARGAGRFILEN